jgi:hypothetical protein
MRPPKTKNVLLALLLLVFVGSSAVNSGIAEGFNTVMSWIVAPFVYLLFVVMLLLGMLIKLNPQIYCAPGESGCVVTAGVDKLVPFFMDILVPLYVIALMFTAGYFVVKSTNPRGRARAKMMLFKLLFSMFLVSLSPMIFQFLLDLQSMITEMILKEGISVSDAERIRSNFTVGAAGALCLMIFILYKIGWVAVCVSILRYILLVLFAVLFPLLLFLYFFDLTRGWGRKYIKMTITWIFTPVVQAFFLVLAFRSLEGFGPFWSKLADKGNGDWFFLKPILAILSPLMGILVVGACMVLVIGAPLIMTKLLNYIGGGLVAWGVATQSVPMTLMGGLLQGMGPGAMRYASGIGTRSGYYGQSRGLIEGGIAGQPSLGLGGLPSGGDFWGATGEGGGAPSSGRPSSGRPSSGRKSQSAKDMAAADSKAATEAPSGPVRGTAGSTYREPPIERRTDEGHTAAGGEEAGGSGAGAAAAGSQRMMPTPRSPQPPAAASTAPAGTLAPSVTAKAGGPAPAGIPSDEEVAEIADKLSNGGALDQQEFQKLAAYVSFRVNEDARKAADAEQRALMKYLDDMNFSAWESRRVRDLELQKQGVLNKTAHVKMGNYLKRLKQMEGER